MGGDHGEEQDVAGSGGRSSPPKAPNPCADAGLAAKDKEQQADRSEAALVVDNEDWDLFAVSATSAVKLLIANVQLLAESTGDIPPTPPVSRPTTPSKEKSFSAHSTPGPSAAKSPMSPVSPISPASNAGSAITPVPMPSPEAHRDEHIPVVGADTESVSIQQAAISRRFFLKSVPPFSLSEYLLRIHQYCPHSPGVYLTAAAYIHRLCVSETLVPATSKTIHRLCLAAIRVASKALEDHKWSQDRFAKVGGVSGRELKSLEVNLCFLLSFELFVREEDLKRHVFQLQRAAAQGMVLRKRFSDGFNMRLTMGRKAGNE